MSNAAISELPKPFVCVLINLFEGLVKFVDQLGSRRWDVVWPMPIFQRLQKRGPNLGSFQPVVDACEAQHTLVGVQQDSCTKCCHQKTVALKAPDCLAPLLILILFVGEQNQPVRRAK